MTFHTGRLGLSVATGGLAEIDRRIDHAWAAFHEQRGKLTSKALVSGVEWLRGAQHAAPVLAFGSWGRSWDGQYQVRRE